MNRRRFLTLAAAFACAPRFAHAATWQGRALGAEVSVTLSGPRDAVDPALAAIPRKLEQIEDLFSLYRPNSVLARLNRDGAAVAPGLFTQLLDQVSQAHDLTDGLFDPTVQPLWKALARGTDPAPARALIGWNRVRRDVGGRVRLGSGQALTLNGIAQGFATDLIRSDLQAQGFDRALIDIGEIAALGGPYRLGLQDPEFGVIGQRVLTAGAIASSSPGALSLGTQAHILGPQGQPPLWSTVSIEAQSATLADALSTAAVFLPVERLRRLKDQAQLRRITLVDHDGNLRTIQGS
ncbi:FAD:protein FMN transferase [Tropicibacter oceani]|uniref:FAD:protein FMN transferase n=1 Tax=Tropicibacter oceani TaxID=3058420 RepID=A0ABY8QFP9_9RHOB|nr:FAD:protein FMN transferase [Tropicibacter oceani]WGW02841.1 FAD:protein FMN transferase [Tropicibacter oceani]